ncbi:hypothetical protein [Cellulomonas chitinilytica]|nr:hypothetical protein [Cellulomonas chitinilytica]
MTLSDAARAAARQCGQDAPPLSPEQVVRLGVLLAGATSERG